MKEHKVLRTEKDINDVECFLTAEVETKFWVHRHGELAMLYKLPKPAEKYFESLLRREK